MPLARNKAFTLIELLVVIAIIGILAALILVSFSGARAKARDAVRKSDLSQVKRALELYNADNGSYPSAIYPNVATTSTTYLKRTPLDPITNSQYRYLATASGTVVTDFAIAADLEDETAQVTLTLTTPTAGSGTGVFNCSSGCTYSDGRGGPGKWYQTSND